MKHTELNNFTFGEYLHQVRDGSCKENKSQSFIITDVKKSHHRGLT